MNIIINDFIVGFPEFPRAIGSPIFAYRENKFVFRMRDSRGSNVEISRYDDAKLIINGIEYPLFKSGNREFVSRMNIMDFLFSGSVFIEVQVTDKLTGNMYVNFFSGFSLFVNESDFSESKRTNYPIEVARQIATIVSPPQPPQSSIKGETSPLYTIIGNASDIAQKQNLFTSVMITNSSFGSMESSGNNVFIGSTIGGMISSSWNNTLIGASIGNSLLSIESNTIVGNNNFVKVQGDRNVVLGANNAYHPSETLLVGNHGNIVVGNDSFTIPGEGSQNNIVIGHSAMYLDNSNVSNSVAIGFISQVTGSNQVQLGGVGTTTYVFGTVQDRSDERDKADISDSQLGLNFIEKLKPRSWKENYRELYDDVIQKNGEFNIDDYPGATILYETETSVMIRYENDGSRKRNRDHFGFIAQEVKEAMDELGVDFGGYQDHSINGGKDVKSLGYNEFIAPMVLAIQELKAEIDSLKAQLNA